jgi:1,4-alpha-glucan branching enzyme
LTKTDLKNTNVLAHSLFTEFDIDLFKAGKHFRLYQKLGAHSISIENTKGVYFAVWAPNAKHVNVIGNFNHWNKHSHALFPRWDHSGIWEGFIPNLNQGEVYKFMIETPEGEFLEKADPFAYFSELPPKTASVVWKHNYEWGDKKWMQNRHEKNHHEAPMSIYELHLGSWRKKNNATESLSYRELAVELVTYIREMGFTHVEFMPIMEHPYFPSWGYQITGYFAPTSRYGEPEELMYLIDCFHQAGIGVMIDWVPSHFPVDAHGLARFDGTHLYEHSDPRLGFHPDWKSAIPNYGRNEVRSFLISNALFWMDRYHIDGLRVDAVASMLYLDYSRKADEWIPNIHGGNQNLEAISFIQEFNATVYKEYPDTFTVAEESTAFSGVSRPTDTGGLGFGQKWMMGWMHDTLNFLSKDPVHRKFHHNEITFSLIYAFTENFMLPLSHDEVVHGKGALIDRMPGDDWQRFANMRLMYAYMFTHPGTKLLFMGSEFAQTSEWSIERGLDWWLLQYEPHQGVKSLIKDLNSLYTSTPQLYEKQFSPEGFTWLLENNPNDSIIAYTRQGKSAKQKPIIVICNFTPAVREDYRIGVPVAGKYKEILNSDDSKYGGSGVILKSKSIKTVQGEWQGQNQFLSLTIPPLGVIILKCK